MNLTKLKQVIRDLGGSKIFVKELSPNDNSKNQVYLGGSFDILNEFPLGDVTSDSSGNWERDRFKASINFGWIDSDGRVSIAPRAQLILYPKYPEVRFSGFLIGCKDAPSAIMTQRLERRLLFLAISRTGQVLGYAASPSSELAMDFYNLKGMPLQGVFHVIKLPDLDNNKERLIEELTRINHLGWIDSKRLDGYGNVLPCNSSNCGGYTLESELGITPNGFSEPDYLGWEIKQYGVNNFNNTNSSVITLMTPEPTGGFYVTSGIKDFVFRYGYVDLHGREDRMNFGGIHKFGIEQFRTKLKLELIGYDAESEQIKNTSGCIALIDRTGNEAASWTFSSMLKHWNRKHNQACYIPSQMRKVPWRQYQFGNIILLGFSTGFNLFLKEMKNGNIYYDPGIKMEGYSTKPKIKRRSQFRINSKNLSNLYYNDEVVKLK